MNDTPLAHIENVISDIAKDVPILKNSLVFLVIMQIISTTLLCVFFVCSWRKRTSFYNERMVENKVI